MALTLLLALVLLALVLLGLGLGVRYGVVDGPPLNIDLGLVRLVANTNQTPNCNPADPACAAFQLAFGSTNRRRAISERRVSLL